MDKAHRIAQAIKASLAATGRTASSLAACCNMGRTRYYARLKSGNWRVNELAAIASYLGWSPAFLSSLIRG